MRRIPEWIAKHDDETIPARVRVRVFDRYDGKCAISKTKIRPGMPWQLDHIIALCNGGEHRENNLQPVLEQPHREKTADDTALKKKITRTRAKHLGLWKPKGRKLQSRGFRT